MTLNGDQLSSGDYFPSLGDYERFFISPNDELPIIIEPSLLMEEPDGKPPHEIFIDEIQPLAVPTVVSALGPPDRSPCDTHYKFSVEINGLHTNKKKYLYSHKLNRIYVDMESDFSVQFNWGSTDAMFVRATVVFYDEAQAEKRVERCTQHYHQGNTDMEPSILKNVLHSSRPIGTAGVQYCGAVDVADSWFSTLVHLPKPGAAPVTHAYKFVCKSSCSSGINRRALAIIFTLEDINGRVWGRQMVGARVCACPRRDMLKDEAAEGVVKNAKKRVTSAHAPPPANKKIKIEVVDSPEGTNERVLTLPPLEIIGERAAITGLEVMLNMMLQAQQHNPPLAERYEPRIAALRQALHQIQNPTD